MLGISTNVLELLSDFVLDFGLVMGFYFISAHLRIFKLLFSFLRFNFYKKLKNTPSVQCKMNDLLVSVLISSIASHPDYWILDVIPSHSGKEIKGQGLWEQ